MLKAASFYFIVWFEILIVPSLYFCIDIMFCNADSHATTDSKYHHGTNVECWGSVYIIMLIIAFLHLMLIGCSIAA